MSLVSRIPLSHVSWSLLTRCLASVPRMRGLVEAAGPLHLCLSWSLVVIKLFKPQRKIIIILVCVHFPQREAPFPCSGNIATDNPGARAVQGGPRWPSGQECEARVRGPEVRAGCGSR